MSINFKNVLMNFSTNIINNGKNNYYAQDIKCEDYLWGEYPTCCKTMPQRNEGVIFSSQKLKKM